MKIYFEGVLSKDKINLFEHFYCVIGIRNPFVALSGKTGLSGTESDLSKHCKNPCHSSEHTQLMITIIVPVCHTDFTLDRLPKMPYSKQYQNTSDFLRKCPTCYVMNGYVTIKKKIYVVIHQHTVG